MTTRFWQSLENTKHLFKQPLAVCQPSVSLGKQERAGSRPEAASSLTGAQWTLRIGGDNRALFVMWRTSTSDRELAVCGYFGKWQSNEWLKNKPLQVILSSVYYGWLELLEEMSGISLKCISLQSEMHQFPFVVWLKMSWTSLETFWYF